MEYVNFGKAGVKVSPLALGLGFRRQSDPIAVQRVIEHAIDLGINFIDCANVYSVGTDQDNIVHSETVLGKALQGKRDDVVITTKAASPVGSGPNDVGLSRYHIMREVDRSLTRLNTDRIDVYLEYGIQEVSNTIISTVKQLAGELGKTPAQLALAWVLSHPEITVAIIGCDTMVQVTENVGALGRALDDSVREKLDAVSAPLT